MFNVAGAVAVVDDGANVKGVAAYAFYGILFFHFMTPIFYEWKKCEILHRTLFYAKRAIGRPIARHINYTS